MSKPSINEIINKFVSSLNAYFLSELSSKITESEVNSYEKLRNDESTEFDNFGKSDPSKTSEDFKSNLEYIKNTMDDISKSCLDEKDDILKTLSWIYIELFMNIYLISEDINTQSSISYKTLKEDYDFIQRFKKEHNIDIDKTFEILARHYDEEFKLESCTGLTIKELVENFLKVMGSKTCKNNLADYILNPKLLNKTNINQPPKPVCSFNPPTIICADAIAAHAAGGSTLKNNNIINKKTT